MIAGLAVLAVLPRVTMEIAAGWKARTAVVEATASGLNDEEKAFALARWAASHWAAGDNHWIYRFTPFLYHRYLPEMIRLPRGSIELFLRRGGCDSAGAMFAFLLRSEGIESRQLDFVGLTKGGHSALTVSVDRREVFVDPFFGVAFRENGHLLDFDDAQTRTGSGVPVERIALKEHADFGFYNDIMELLHAKAGMPLDIAVALPAAMDIGRIDSSSRDVESGTTQWRLSSYQHFLGARYSRYWRKIYRVEVPTLLTFYLTEEVSQSALPKSNIAPRVKGNVVEYRIDCSNCELVLDPQEVPWDWRRMKAWYDVDRLVVRPLAGFS